MDKDTKVLLMAIVIILVALVSFNLSDLTGKITGSDITTIAVSHTLVEFEPHVTAKMITIRVSPSNEGIKKKIEMYKCKDEDCDNVIRVGTETANICTSNTCYDDVTISYRISSGLKVGKYYFVAKDRNGNKVSKSNTFNVV